MEWKGMDTADTGAVSGGTRNTAAANTQLATSELMPNRIRIVLAVGFGLLVVLIAFSGFSALQRANEIHAGISALHEADHETEVLLGRIRSDLQLSAITVRDFALDPTSEGAAPRAELHRLQESSAAALNHLRPLTRPQDATRFESMRHEMNEFWNSLNPIFSWSAAQRASGSASFLRARAVPRRQAALDLSRQIEELTAGGIRERRAEIDRRQADLPGYVERIIGATILVGVLIAVASILRIVRLEKLAAVQHARVRETESELRRLSRELVRTQEEERRSLSRELHDQIGQLLTAVGIGLGNLEEKLGICPEPARGQLDQTRRIAEQALRSVRDMAMGLRPAMLDDLGLGAALQWQARQHARLCGVPVTVEFEDDLDSLSDAQRTCIYRMVQEALNNIAKHAAASRIGIEVGNRAGLISVVVRDDGRGLPATSDAGRGLGILGIKERVRELGGQVTLDSTIGQGTALIAVIPLSGRKAECPAMPEKTIHGAHPAARTV